MSTGRCWPIERSRPPTTHEFSSAGRQDWSRQLLPTSLTWVIAPNESRPKGSGQPVADVSFDDRHFDGNVLAGALFELFGREMTDQLGCCGACGAVSQLGATIVYRGAGDVIRCAACKAVLMVLVGEPNGGFRISMAAMRWIYLEAQPS